MLIDYIYGFDICYFGLFYLRKRIGNKFVLYMFSDLSLKFG